MSATKEENVHVELIGTGSYGEVKRLTWPDGTSVALKSVALSETNRGLACQNVEAANLAELSIHRYLSRLGLRYVIPLLESFVDKTYYTRLLRSELGDKKPAVLHLHHVTPVCDCDALSYFRLHARKLSVEERVDALLSFKTQLVDALTELHEANVLHGDVSPRNVIVNYNLNKITDVWLCDFGHSIYGVSKKTLCANVSAPVYTMPYQPPEARFWGNSLGVELFTQCVVAFDTQITRGSDMYAAAMSLIHVLVDTYTKTRPFLEALRELSDLRVERTLRFWNTLRYSETVLEAWFALLGRAWLFLEIADVKCCNDALLFGVMTLLFWGPAVGISFPFVDPERQTEWTERAEELFSTEAPFPRSTKDIETNLTSFVCHVRGAVEKDTLVRLAPLLQWCAACLHVDPLERPLAAFTEQKTEQVPRPLSSTQQTFFTDRLNAEPVSVQRIEVDAPSSVLLVSQLNVKYKTFKALRAPVIKELWGIAFELMAHAVEFPIALFCLCVETFDAYLLHTMDADAFQFESTALQYAIDTLFLVSSATGNVSLFIDAYTICGDETFQPNAFVLFALHHIGYHVSLSLLSSFSWDRLFYTLEPALNTNVDVPMYTLLPKDTLSGDLIHRYVGLVDKRKDTMSEVFRVLSLSTLLETFF